MVKQRVIAVIVVKDSLAVQSIGFERYLPIGKPEIAAEFLNEWGVDEIVLVDIDAMREKRLIDLDLVQKVAQKIFTPLCVGGGIRTKEDIKKVLDAGADKVAVNQMLFDRDFLQEATHYFGKQCIVASVDITKKEGEYRIYDYLSRSATHDPFTFIDTLDVGEILVNVVEKDGMKSGYETALYQELTKRTNIPVIALGGAKNPYDMQALLDSVPNISAVAAANFFHYFEHSVAITKAILKKEKNRPVRHDGLLRYDDFNFDEDGRLVKKADEELEKMLFEYHEKEVI